MSEDIYEKLTEKILLKGSKIIPELFRMMADQEEAELLAAMPGTPEQLAEKLGKPVANTEKLCRTLYEKGLAFKSFKSGVTGYKLCRDMTQFHDATILWPQATKQYFDLWQKFMEQEWPNYARIVAKIFPRPITRVIPVKEAVETGKQQVLDVESAIKIINDAEFIAVTKCTCRIIAHKCDHPVEVCLQVGNAAKYTIDRGSGREITKEEALKILDEAEKSGLVHVTMNKAHVGHFICNCCGCCCVTMPLLISEGLKLTDPSRYLAKVNPELCAGCGTCLDRCFFNALKEVEAEDGAKIMSVIAEKCMGCGLCNVTCPEEAISLVEVRPLTFIPS